MSSDLHVLSDLTHEQEAVFKMQFQENDLKMRYKFNSMNYCDKSDILMLKFVYREINSYSIVYSIKPIKNSVETFS